MLSRVLLLAVLAALALVVLSPVSSSAERVSYPVVYNEEAPLTAAAAAEPANEPQARIFLEAASRQRAQAAKPKKQTKKAPAKKTTGGSKKTAAPKKTSGASKQGSAPVPRVGSAGVPKFNPNGANCRAKFGTPAAGSWTGSAADREASCPKAARSISYGLAAARPGSLGCCGVGVGNALLAAGIGNIQGAADACNKGPALQQLGYVRLPNTNNPQPGDVWIWSCSSAHRHGHIQIKTATGWVTDFVQRNPSPWRSTGGSTATAYRLAASRC